MSVARPRRTGRGEPHGLLRNGAAIAVASNLTAGLGYLFWTAATRNVSSATVGLAATVVSAVLLVTVLATGGLVPLLIRLLSRAPAEEFSALCSSAFLVGVAAAAVGGAVGCLFLPASIVQATGTAWLLVVMIGGSAGSALLLLVGAALVGARRADLSLVANVAASLIRLVGVVALVVAGVFASAAATSDLSLLLVLWLASFAVSAGVALRLLAWTRPRLTWRPTLGALRVLGRSMGWEYATTLGTQLPQFMIPVLAAHRLTASQVGYLYMAAMVGSAFFSVAAAMATALLAESPSQPHLLAVKIRRSLAISAAVLVVPVTLVCLHAERIMDLFGTEYGHRTATLLTLIVLASCPDIVTTVAVTVLRLRGELSRAAGLNVGMGLIHLTGAWFAFPRLGITAAGWAELTAQLTGTAVIAVMTLSRRRLRSGRPPTIPARRPPRQLPDRLRILHVTDTFRPNVGGLELAVADLARAQAERGDTVLVATATHPAAPHREDDGPLRVRRLPMTLSRLPGAYLERGRYFFPPVPDPEFAHAFARLLRQFRPDVIHVHGWVLHSVTGAALAAGVPVVATAHDHSQVCATKTLLHRDTHPCSGPGLGKCLGCALHHYGAKGVPLALGLHGVGSRRHRSVAAWLAISSAVAAHGSAPRPADRRPMTVVPTYLDDDLLVRARDARTLRRPGFVPPTGDYLFYAGALSPAKGVDVLLAAHRMLRDGGLDVPLVLAGLHRPGFLVEPGPGVTVARGVPFGSVMAAWRHAAVGVVPSVVEEGFGRVAVECLAAGTPCVVSARGGLVDVVADGVEGLHVPPGDPAALAAALHLLLTDHELRARLAAAGPAKAARFALSQVLPRVDDVYRGVLSGALADQALRSEEVARR